MFIASPVLNGDLFPATFCRQDCGGFVDTRCHQDGVFDAFFRTEFIATIDIRALD
jgi:hypothetical protein